MRAAAWLTPSTTWSNTLLCAYRREPAAQTWPALKKMALAAPPTTASMLASGSTITGDFPPSSSDTRLRVSVADLLISLPTGVEPVKATLSTPGCATSAAPVVSPIPVRMLTTPGGKPASVISSPSRSADSGVCSAGFSTQVQPQARAGPELPRRHRQREIPGNDLRHDADGLAQGVGMELGTRACGNRRIEGRAFELRGPAGHVAEIVAGVGHIDHAGDELGLAVVQALQFRQLIGVLLDEVRELPQQRFALHRQHVVPGPLLEGCARGRHRPVHVGLVGVGDDGDLASRSPDPSPECALADAGLDPLPADQQPRADAAGSGRSVAEGSGCLAISMAAFTAAFSLGVARLKSTAPRPFTAAAPSGVQPTAL